MTDFGLRSVPYTSPCSPALMQISCRDIILAVPNRTPCGDSVMYKYQPMPLLDAIRTVGLATALTDSGSGQQVPAVLSERSRGMYVDCAYACVAAIITRSLHK